MTDTIINLSKSEQDTFTFVQSKVRYYVRGEHICALQATGNWGSRYVDADDLADIASSNGQGYHLKTREYACTELEGDERAHIAHLGELVALMSEFPAGYLEAMTRQQRIARLEAELHVNRSMVDGRRTARVEPPGEGWAILPIALPVMDEDDCL